MTRGVRRLGPYTSALGPTDQKSPLLGRTDQVANSEGGFVWQVDKWTRLHRFLVIGSEGGTYYVNEHKLTRQNANAVMECMAEDGKRTVDLIVEISEAGRAPRNDPALFALALCATEGDDATRRVALAALPRVARTGTHLFTIVDFLNQSGWSRGKRTAVANWYLEKTPDALAYQLVKYRQRNGWTHRDVLRQVHPKADTSETQNVLKFAVTGNTSTNENAMIEAFIRAQASDSSKRTIEIIKNYPGIPREALKTEHLNTQGVQMALLENGMPMMALVRNLGNMSKSGLLKPMSEAEKIVCTQLTNTEAISKSRIHPIQLLTALKTYGAGHGFRGTGTWDVSARVMDCLDAAFYAAFGNVQAANKRTLLALDVSSSMSHAAIGGMNISAAEGSCAMAMVTAAAEMQHMMVAFTAEGAHWSGRNSLTVLNFSPRQRLDDLVKETQAMNFGATDCSLPVVAALQNQWIVDTFIIYTDSETFAGQIHVSEALKEYRKRQVPNAKLVVVGMTSNGFSIADPNDAGMLDVVGFDTATPNVITDFSRS